MRSDFAALKLSQRYQDALAAALSMPACTGSLRRSAHSLSASRQVVD